MSEAILNLILQRLDGIELGEAHRFESIERRFEQIDQRFEQIGQRFDRIDQRLGEIDQRFQQIDLRFEQIEQRLDHMEREQTRLRVDMLNQMERILTTVQGLKDDVTVSMAYAARADASADTTAALQRSMQSQLSHLRNRVERLEEQQGDRA